MKSLEDYEKGKKEVVDFTEPIMEEIGSLVSDIRGDWTDPRYECRKIWELLDKWGAYING